MALGGLSLLYDVLVPFAALAAAPAYLARSLKHPEYRAHLGERVGRLPEELRHRLEKLERRPVWVQAVSVGEVSVASTLIRGLAERGPADSSPITSVLSSTTPAGRQAAASVRAAGLAGVFHFPIDWSPIMSRALDAIRPAALVCVETELWPSLLGQCARRKLPVLVVNGRISERSHGRYRRLGALLHGPLGAVRLACMQSERDARRMRAIGLEAGRVVVTGNMKYDAVAPSDAEPRQLREIAPPPGVPLLVAGSTSRGEEEQVLDALSAPGLERVLLILAPRHRERFDEVAALLDRRGLAFTRRTQRAEAPWAAHRVLLLDTIGELASAYCLATVAFVGGSLVRRGGQNLLEPSARGVPVLFGPHTDNFKEISLDLLAAGGGFLVHGPRDLGATLRGLVDDEGLRRRAGAAGRALIEAHRGATGRTIDQILPYLK